MPEYETQVQQAPTADGQKLKVQVVHQSLMSFLVNSCRDQATGQHLVFGQSVIANKFALIFVRLACRDFPEFWNSQFSDLFSLLQQPNVDQKYRLQLISKCFISTDSRVYRLHPAGVRDDPGRAD